MSDRRAPTAQHLPTTDWQLLAAARKRTRHGRDSLAAILEMYEPSLRLYLRQTWGFGEQDVEEVIAAFFAEKVIERGLVERADRRLGRFRGLLTTALQRYVIDRLRRSSAAAAVSSPAAGDDADDPPARNNADPAAAFDRAWARSVVAEAVARTREHCEKTDRLAFWALFEHRVVAPAADGVPPTPYAQLLAGAPFPTPTHAANALATAKRLFERKLREVLLEHAGPDADVDEELRGLRQALGG